MRMREDIFLGNLIRILIDGGIVNLWVFYKISRNLLSCQED